MARDEGCAFVTTCEHGTFKDSGTRTSNARVPVYVRGGANDVGDYVGLGLSVTQAEFGGGGNNRHLLRPPVPGVESLDWGVSMSRVVVRGRTGVGQRITRVEIGGVSYALTRRGVHDLWQSVVLGSNPLFEAGGDEVRFFGVGGSLGAVEVQLPRQVRGDRITSVVSRAEQSRTVSRVVEFFRADKFSVEIGALSDVNESGLRVSEVGSFPRNPVVGDVVYLTRTLSLPRVVTWTPGSLRLTVPSEPAGSPASVSVGRLSGSLSTTALGVTRFYFDVRYNEVVRLSGFGRGGTTVFTLWVSAMWEGSLGGYASGVASAYFDGARNRFTLQASAYSPTEGDRDAAQSLVASRFRSRVSNSLLGSSVPYPLRLVRSFGGGRSPPFFDWPPNADYVEGWYRWTGSGWVAIPAPANPRRLTRTFSGGIGAVSQTWRTDVGTLSGSASVAGTSKTSTDESPWLHLPSDVDEDTLVTVDIDAERGGQDAEDEESFVIFDRTPRTFDIEIGALGVVNMGAPAVRLSSVAGGTATGDIDRVWRCDDGLTLSDSATEAGSLRESRSFEPWLHFPETVLHDRRLGVRLEATRQRVGARDSEHVLVRRTPWVDVDINALGVVRAGGSAMALGAVVATSEVGVGVYAWTVDGGVLDDASSATPMWTPPARWLDGDEPLAIGLTVTYGVGVGNDVERVRMLDAAVPARVDVDVVGVGDVDEGAAAVRLSSVVESTATGTVSKVWTTSLGTLSGSATEAGDSRTYAGDNPWLHYPESVGGVDAPYRVGCVATVGTVSGEGFGDGVVRALTLDVDIDAVADQDGSAGGVVRLGYEVGGSVVGAVSQVWTTTVGTFSGGEDVVGYRMTSEEVEPWLRWSRVVVDTLVVLTLVVRRGGRVARARREFLLRAGVSFGEVFTARMSRVAAGGVVGFDVVSSGTATGRINRYWWLSDRARMLALGVYLSKGENDASGSWNQSLVDGAPWLRMPDVLAQDLDVTVNMRSRRGGVQQLSPSVVVTAGANVVGPVNERVFIKERRAGGVYVLALVLDGSKGAVTKYAWSAGDPDAGDVGVFTDAAVAEPVWTVAANVPVEVGVRCAVTRDGKVEVVSGLVTVG